jgi:flagellar hook-length control protein FliK
LPVAAGFMEIINETTMPLPTNQVHKTGKGEGERSVEKDKTEDFSALLKDLVETSEEEVKAPTDMTENLWTQLLLLYPQLINGETISGEAEDPLSGGEKAPSLTGLSALMAQSVEGVETAGAVEVGKTVEKMEPVEAAGAVNTVEVTKTAGAVKTGEAVDMSAAPISGEAVLNEPLGSLAQTPAPTAQPDASAKEQVLSDRRLSAEETPGQIRETTRRAQQLAPFLPGDEPGTRSEVTGPDESGQAQTGEESPILSGETIVGIGVHGESADRYRQTHSREDGGQESKNFGGDESGKPAPAMGIAPDRGDSNRSLERSMETGDEQPAFKAGAKTSTNNARRFGKTTEPIFNPVESLAPTQPVKENVAVAPKVTASLDGEELKAQMISHVKLMVKDGVSKIQIQLEPAELGKMELSLVVERDLVAARFVTENQGVQSLIEANLPELRSSLEEAGLRVDLLQVGVETGANPQQQEETTAGSHQFKRNSPWNSSVEMLVSEENIFADEAWHGTVNLRV